MRHIVLAGENEFNIAVLIKESGLRKEPMIENYVDRLKKLSFDCQAKGVIGFNVKYNKPKTVTVSYAKEYLDSLLPELKQLETKYILVTDTPYFKILTGYKKVDGFAGYVLPCVIKGYEHFNIILGINYQAMFYNPNLSKKLDLSIKALVDHSNDSYKELGTGLLKKVGYIHNLAKAKRAFTYLHKFPTLELDTEAFSLDFWKAGLGTFSFSWNQSDGFGFQCDYEELPEMNDEKHYGKQVNNIEMKKLLKEFLRSYKGTIRYHNANYDLKVLCYELWMEDLLDTKGMTEGIKVLTKNFDCTKIITYLATNTTAGNKLSLKEQAHEFAGNYAQSEIKDIRKIPLMELLKYNVVDCVATNYVYTKNYPIMVQDDQLSIYNEIFKPSVKKILRMELVGLPLDMDEVKKVNTELRGYEKEFNDRLAANPLVVTYKLELQEKAYNKWNDRWKKKEEPFEYFADHPDAQFNPGSSTKVADLLFNHIGLPVQGLTKGKSPSVDGDALADLKYIAKEGNQRDIIECLIGLSELSTILSNFINTFLTRTVLKSNGVWYLHGGFNLGGTKSGRLSSSGPNLQNIPSTSSKYAKHIKRCFRAPKGWLFVGADFSSLEDYISALITKDSNKLKVYLQKYDGHNLRAFTYFPDRMPSVKEKMEELAIKQRFFKITLDNGDVEYVSESELNRRGIKIPT